VQREADVSTDLADAMAIFADVRPRLFGIAYRMLSSVADAEDIVQDVWLRWQTCDRDAVRNAAAFLVTATTRMCINHMQSAHARRETYVGPWLPEPVDTSADPALGAERGAALHVATLMLLERLSPTERAAYVLREAFDYPYELIGTTIQVTEVNARQLVSRARKQLAAGRRESSPPTDPRRLLTAFVTAANTGNMTALETVFAAEAAC
jgi:RNA polymerase sigma-70 factor (ECF subfamily)